MNRRTFLEYVGLSSLGFFGVGCAATVLVPEGDGSVSVDAGDGATLYPDVVPEAASDGRGQPLYTIERSFVVLLNDSTCSQHSHGVHVPAGAFYNDNPVRFLGGSHLLEVRPSELVMLELGMRIPFATIGNGPGHGHCGTAWRRDVGPEEPRRPDSCRTLGTAMCEPYR